MFTIKKREETALEKAIREATEWLDPSSDDYSERVDNIVKMYKLKEQDRKFWKRIDPDAVVGAAANIAGILLILHYEQLHVVTSKALPFVHKAK
jgi:hypothetical protein